MAFRDDNQALRAQIEALQHDLQEKEARHAEEREADRRDREALEAKIARLRARKQRSEARPAAGISRRKLVLILAGSVGMMAGVGGFVLLARPSKPAAADPPPNLVGKWRVVDSSGKEQLPPRTIELGSGGKLRMADAERTEEGTWSVAGNTLRTAVQGKNYQWIFTLGDSFTLGNHLRLLPQAPYDHLGPLYLKR
jgi:hypothetical protein